MNRGWVPRQLMHPSTRPEGQEEGDVALTAIVRKTEKACHWKTGPERMVPEPKFSLFTLVASVYETFSPTYIQYFQSDVDQLFV